MAAPSLLVTRDRTGSWQGPAGHWPRQLVRFAAVSKRYAGVPAVKEFNLDIAAGEFVSLLGPSGCGKTTLLRMLAGFEFPDSGRIVLDGRDITAVPAHKRPVNMVFQRVTLFPHLNVFENIAFGLRLKRVSAEDMRRRVGEALELVRLPGFADAVTAHRDVAASALLSGSVDERVAAATLLGELGDMVLVALAEPLVQAATSTSAKVRDAGS